jgi:hypothetical protein
MSSIFNIYLEWGAIDLPPLNRSRYNEKILGPSWYLTTRLKINHPSLPAFLTSQNKPPVNDKIHHGTHLREYFLAKCVFIMEA